MTTLNEALSGLRADPNSENLTHALGVLQGIAGVNVTVDGNTITALATGNSVEVLEADAAKAGARDGELAWTIVFANDARSDSMDSYIGADSLVTALHSWAEFQDIPDPTGVGVDRVRGFYYELDPELAKEN